MDGIKALNLIKEKYELENKLLDKMRARNRSSGVPKLVRPFICFYTSESYNNMLSHTIRGERPDYYLQKPLPLKDLVSLLRLVNIL